MRLAEPAAEAAWYSGLGPRRHRRSRYGEQCPVLTSAWPRSEGAKERRSEGAKERRSEGAKERRTCNNANVPAGLLLGLGVAIAVAAALTGEALVVAWLLARRRVALGWLVALAVALAVDALCVWQITDIWALRAGLEAGTAGGKGVCQVFANQHLVLVVCAVGAIVLAAATGASVQRAWHDRDTTTRT